MKIGNASVSTSHGHTFQLRPSHMASQSRVGVEASSPIPTPVSSSTGTASHHRLRRRAGVGRASRRTPVTTPMPGEMV